MTVVKLADAKKAAPNQNGDPERLSLPDALFEAIASVYCSEKP